MNRTYAIDDLRALRAEIQQGGDRGALIQNFSIRNLSALRSSYLEQGCPDIRGAGVVPGAASGKLALSLKQASQFMNNGHRTVIANVPQIGTILEHPNFAGYISPSYDREMMSHQTGLVAQFGIPTITGVPIRKQRGEERWFLGEIALQEGQTVTIDGGSGALYLREERVYVYTVSKTVLGGLNASLLKSSS